MNITQLFEELCQTIKEDCKSIECVKEVLEKYDGDDWQQFANLDKNFHCKTVVAMTDCFDVYVIGWNKGQASQIHDHAEKGCVMKVLKGKLIEERYSKKLEFVSKKKLKKGHIGYISNQYGYHSIKNNSNQPAFSLHVYSPPQYQAKYYDA